MLKVLASSRARSLVTRSEKISFNNACYRYASATASEYDYDILIAGGSVVGATVAAKLLKALRGSGGEGLKGKALKIGIVDARAPPTLSSCLEKETPDTRVYAISPKSISILNGIGAWKYLENRSQSYTTMQVWESTGPGVVRFSAADAGASELGQIAEDCTIQAAVYKVIEELAPPTGSREGDCSIEIIFGATVSGLQIEKSAAGPHSVGPASVTLSAIQRPGTAPPSNDSKESFPRKVTARLVVGADGAVSSVRRLSGLSTWGWNYGQEAIVCTVKLEDVNGNGAGVAGGQVQPHYKTAWQRYLPLPTAGPVAMLPLWGAYASIVWSCAVPEAKRLCALPKEEFLRELNHAFQSPSPVDRWSPYNLPDALPFSPVTIANTLAGAAAGAAGAATNAVNTAAATVSSTVTGSSRGAWEPLPPPSLPLFLSTIQSTINKVIESSPLPKVRKEVAALADSAMQASIVGDPPKPAPKISEISGERLTFPLQFQQAKVYYAPRVVLVGDAAHSIHPQAGQGLNLGLGDADHLVDVLLEALASGQDIGDVGVISKYGDKRYAIDLGMMTTVDVIHNVFSIGKHVPLQSLSPVDSPVSGDANAGTSAAASNPAGVVGSLAKSVLSSPMTATVSAIEKAGMFLRSAGMLGVHGLGPLKGTLAKVAMGLEIEVRK